MKQSKLIGVILLVLGGVLLYFGFNATGSFAEEVSESFTGKYSDETMAYLIGGAISAVLGLVLLIKK